MCKYHRVGNWQNINFSGLETRILWENKVNTMAADALASGVTSTSAGMIQSVPHKQDRFSCSNDDQYIFLYSKINWELAELMSFMKMPLPKLQTFCPGSKFMNIWRWQNLENLCTRDLFQYKDRVSKYKNSHHKDHYNEQSYTGKAASLYETEPWALIQYKDVILPV